MLHSFPCEIDRGRQVNMRNMFPLAAGVTQAVAEGTTTGGAAAAMAGGSNTAGGQTDDAGQTVEDGMEY